MNYGYVIVGIMGVAWGVALTLFREPLMRWQQRNRLRRSRGPMSERRLSLEALGLIPLGLMAFAVGLLLLWRGLVGG